MKKIETKKDTNKNKSGILVAGLVALVIALIGYGLLMIIENKIMAGYDKVDVYVFAQDYGKGTKVEDYSMFSVMTVEASTVPEGTIRDVEKIYNTYLAGNVKKNEMCMEEDFRVHKEDTDKVIELTFSAENMNGNLAGTLRTADCVDIYLIPDSIGDVYGSTIGTGQQFYLEILRRKLNSILEAHKKYGDPEEDIGVTEEDYATLEAVLLKIVEIQKTDTDDYGEFLSVNQQVVSELLIKFGELELLEEYKRILQSLGDLSPDYERVFIEKAYTGDGIEIDNLDTTSVATMFKISLNKDDAKNFITRQQYCKIWLVKNNDSSSEEDDIVTENTDIE